MPWNETDRVKYAVIRQRYASDLSDEEFALVQPLLPASKPCGRKPTDPRAILGALFYLVRAGCPWRYLPKDMLITVGSRASRSTRTSPIVTGRFLPS